MPIIANNMIVNDKKVEEKPVMRSPPPSQPTITPIVPLEQVSLVPKMHYDKEKHGVVIVDGKEKKISKHSAYILDMLSLDND